MPSFTVLSLIQCTGVLRIITRHTNNNRPGVDGISSAAVTRRLSGETNNGWCPSLKRPLQTQHLSPVEEKSVCCFQSFRSLTLRQMASFSLFSCFSAEKPEKQIERWTRMHVIMSALADTLRQRRFRLWDQIIYFLSCFKTLKLGAFRTIYDEMSFSFDILALEILHRIRVAYLFRILLINVHQFSSQRHDLDVALMKTLKKKYFKWCHVYKLLIFSK